MWSIRDWVIARMLQTLEKAWPVMPWVRTSSIQSSQSVVFRYSSLGKLRQSVWQESRISCRQEAAEEEKCWQVLYIFPRTTQSCSNHWCHSQYVPSPFFNKWEDCISLPSLKLGMDIESWSMKCHILHPGRSLTYQQVCNSPQSFLLLKWSSGLWSSISFDPWVPMINKAPADPQ